MMGRNLPRDLKVLSGAFFFLFMGAGAQQQFLLPHLRETTSWGTMQYSLILATVYISFMLWRLGIGHSIRALGEYRSIVLGSLTYTAFVGTVLSSRSYPLTLAMALLWGWGAASLWTTGGTRVLNISRRERYGTSSGVLYLCTSLGFTLGVVALGATRTRWGGDAMYGLALGLSLAGNPVLPFLARGGVLPPHRPLGEVLKLMRTRRVKMVGSLQFVSALSFGLLLGTVADFLPQAYGWRSLLLTASFPLARALTSLGGGTLSDRIGRGKVIALALGTSGLALLTSAGWTTPLSLGLGILILGCQSGVVPTTSLALAGDVAEPERRPLVLGAMFFWRDLGVVTAILGGQYLRVALGTIRAPLIAFGLIFLACAVWSLKLEEVR